MSPGPAISRINGRLMKKPPSMRGFASTGTRNTAATAIIYSLKSAELMTRERIRNGVRNSP